MSAARSGYTPGVGTFLGTALGALSLILPGILAVRLLDDGDLLWRVGIGFGIGVLVVPFAGFLLAWMLGTSMSAGTLGLASVLLSVPLWAAGRRRSQ